MIPGTTTAEQPPEENAERAKDPAAGPAPADADTADATHATDATDAADAAERTGAAAQTATATATDSDASDAAADSGPDSRADSGAAAKPLPFYRSWSPHLVPLSVMCGLATALYCTLGLVRFANFRVSSYDLVIFDQAVRGYANFSAPTVPLRGVTGGFGMDYLQLADHFSPILALLAPFYWLHDGPQTLIVAQAVLFAAAIPFVWNFTRRVLGTPHAYLVAVAYAISWPIATTVSVDFHEVAFVPLLSAIAIDRLHAGKTLPGLIAVGALLITKEDMGLMVLGLGAWQFLTGRRKLGVGLMVTGVTVLELVRRVLIPWAGGDPSYYWRYNQIGENVPELLWFAVTRPHEIVAMLFNEHSKWDTWGLLLWPSLFLCLLSPLVLAALPLILERLLAESENWWSTGWHYDSFVIVILLLAGVDGAARLIRWLRKREKIRQVSGWKLAYAAAVCAVAVTTVPYRPFDQLMSPEFYKPDPRYNSRVEAMKLIPDGVVVEASDDFGPKMSSRTTVLWWDYQKRGTPWIIASINPDLRGLVDSYLTEGYELLFDREDIIVLHRIGA